jgi:acyl-CoA thioester hydrolase
MMMPNSPKKFEDEIVVQPEHLDESDHVNNVVYVQFMQEIANKHWSSVTNADLEDNVIWVVRRHEIDYFAEAFLHDTLLLRTWTGEHTAVTWTRYCEIIRKADQKKIITSKSVWVMLDRQTGKPKRIDEKMLSRFGE